MRVSMGMTNLGVLVVACWAAACSSDTGQSQPGVMGAGASGSATSSAAGKAGSSMVGTGGAGTSAAIGTAGQTASAAGTGVTAGSAASGAAGVAAGTGASGASGGAGGAAAGAGGAGGSTAGTGGASGHSGQGGSSGAGQAGSGGSAGGGATFSAVYKILMTGCMGATCHVGATRAGDGLAMTDKMTAFNNLVGANSVSCTGEKRVVAGDPMKSELVHTLDRTQIGSCFNTPKMPDNKPKLAQADIDTITAWIKAGAMND
jgi:hypothetical protein